MRASGKSWRMARMASVSIHQRHLHVHQSDVWTMGPELLNRFTSIIGFRDYKHIRFAGQDGRDPFAQYGMVVYYEKFE